MLKFEWPLLLPDDEGIKNYQNTDIDEYIVDITQRGLVEGLQEIDGGVTVIMPAMHIQIWVTKHEI